MLKIGTEKNKLNNNWECKENFESLNGQRRFHDKRLRGFNSFIPTFKREQLKQWSKLWAGAQLPSKECWF